jgi:hypothetical protein
MCEAKSWVSSDWLISSSKLQPCLELCWFTQVLLKTKVVRWKAQSPPQKLWKDPCATFIRTDGVLLEVRNQKVECCIWSLVAATNRILTLKLTASQTLMIGSLSSLFESSLDFPKERLHIVPSQSSVLIGSRLSSSHTMVIPQPFTFLLYWCSCITYSEWGPYMASVHSQAVWSWSQPCTHISILS